MAEAVAERSFIRATSLPETMALVTTLESLAADLDIAACNRSHFVNGLGEAVSRVWRRHSDAKCTSKQIERAIAGCREIDARCSRLLKSLGGEAEVWCRKQQGDGFEEYRAKLEELTYLVAHLNAWACKEKPRPGAQGSKARPTANFEMFLINLCHRAHAAGHPLTANKNNIDEGSLPRVIRALEPHLPPGLLPPLERLMPGMLERVRRGVAAYYEKGVRVDAKYKENI